MKQFHKKFVSTIVAIGTLLFCNFNLTNAQTEDVFPLKLRVGTYNVGHFNHGVSTDGYRDPDVQARLEFWRNWIGKQSFDILFVQEWNHKFDVAKTLDAVDELLKPHFSNSHFGEQRNGNWIYNGFASKRELKNIRQVDLPNGYYALVGDMPIGGKTITVISAHLPWQDNSNGVAIEALIKEMKKYEYVICGGDMNASDENQRKFSDAGFNIANGGESGWFLTYPENFVTGNGSYHLDNIVTSRNITIKNVSAPITSLNDNDHYPMLADVIVER